MNFNKEIKHTHDEIQKLHEQFDQLNSSLAQQFQDITNVVRENAPVTLTTPNVATDTKKIEVVVRYEDSTFTRYTLNAILALNVCLIGIFVAKNL